MSTQPHKPNPTPPQKPSGPQSPLPKGAGQPMRQVQLQFQFNFRKILLWLIIGLIGLSLLTSLLQGDPRSQEISLSQLIADAKEGKIERIEVSGSKLSAFYNGQTVPNTSRIEDRGTLTEVFQSAGVDLTSLSIEVADQSMSRLWIDVLVTMLPLLLMGGFILFLARQARGSQDGVFSFGRSKAKLFAKGKQDVKFKDVGGVDEAKKELEEVVDFLKNPKKYKAMGARTPKGVLLIGPAGTGKTLLARAVAGEADVPFFSMAGSEFMEMLVGVGASRVRDLFDTAKKASPSIIFIDEIDAIGRMRGMGSASGHDEREQTLNQILVEMDGFSQNDNVVVLAATNRGDLLDPALTRPGRFDRRVQLDLPDIEERLRVLKIHAANKPIDKSISWDRLAKRTVGFSGADLENMLNEAAIAAARDARKQITWEDIEEAATKVKMGPSKKRLSSELEKRMTAYHEAGHALVSHFLPFTDSVHRVSIVSRGRALGFTMTPPEQDKYQQTRTELIQDMAVMMGGREAEQLVFGELTAGASSDISRATRIARAMVVDFGMSDLGPIYLGPQYETTEWGKAIYDPTNVSDRVQGQVDKEISKLILQSQAIARKLLETHRRELDVVSKELLEKETLDGDDFERIVGLPKVRPAASQVKATAVKKRRGRPARKPSA